MRKFPETIATKQDVENIINHHPEHQGRLKSILLRAVNEPERCEQVVSYDVDPETGEMINIKTKQITRPNQTWKRLGYENKGELVSKLAQINKVL